MATLATSSNSIVDEDVAANHSDSDTDDSNEDGSRGHINLSALEGELSAETLAALQMHIAETDAAQAAASEMLHSSAADQKNALPSEDFGMSQFWWDDASAEALGLEAISVSLPNLGGDGSNSSWRSSTREPRKIGILSAPSVWLALQRLLARGANDVSELSPNVSVAFNAGISASARDDRHFLLEFDKRFASAAQGAFEFAFYDYSNLSTVPAELHGSCDYLLAGPPYISTPCIDLYIQAFDLLARHPDTPRAIVIGASLEEALAERGFVVADDIELSYQSKFCTPMRLYRKYREDAVIEEPHDQRAAT